MARFGRVLTAMVTPFTDAGELDPDGAAVVARYLVDHGSEGLILAGTTGESPTLSSVEQVELFRSVREAVDVPLIAGTGANSTKHSIELTEAASDTGIDGVLVVTPYYNRPSQQGLDQHFRAVAAATDLPMMIYDIPFRTGRKVNTDTLLTLAAEVPNIVAVKDAAGDVVETGRLISEAPDGFEVYSGDDKLFLPLLAVGAVGLIGVATHWAGPQFVEMQARFEKGDLAGARQLFAQLLPSCEFESTDDAPNPVPAKAMLRLLGLPVGRCRPPMGADEPADLADRARAVAAQLGLEVS